MELVESDRYLQNLTILGHHIESKRRRVPQSCKPPNTYAKIRNEADEKYECLVAKLRTEGTRWEDPEFPANDKSLGQININCTYSWKRPKEFNPNATFFIKDSLQFSANQGRLGGSWLFPILDAVGKTQSMRKRLMPVQVDIQDERYCGMFRAFFWHFGEWKQVLVDDRLPVDSNNKLIFMSSKNPNEMWVALFEKAYANLEPSGQTVLINLGLHGPAPLK
ncbi:unnamed protein product [Echinostoma caproni]|uniref:Calpain catalytic domain-containing protein n=1 Tax=Echinostoma caproni TaxID=27848 RepID=A0A183AHE4_9TREM|nr:unnamed protein product [Echinostoma caproni]